MPMRKTGELDNRGSHYFLALYWAEAVAAQTDDQKLADHLGSVAKELKDNAEQILEELSVVQGSPADLGGYYHPSPEAADKVMRPSQTLNGILAKAMG